MSSLSTLFRPATVSVASAVGLWGLAALACGREPPGTQEGYREPDLAVAESLLQRHSAPEVDIFGYPVDGLDRRELLRLLRTAEYDSLEAILDDRWRAVQADIREEGRLYHVYEAFARGAPDLGPPLNAWLQKRPQSGAAHLAKAYYMVARAQESRGGRSAFETPRNQMQNMGQFVGLALEEAQAGLRILPDHLIGYQVILQALRFFGSDVQGYDDVVRYATDAHPASFLVRKAIMQSLEPRWGGSYPLMAALAEEAGAYADRNPRLLALSDFPAIDRASVALRNHAADSAVAIIGRLGQHRVEYTVALEAADVYIDRGDYLAALRYLRIAEDQLPQGRSMLESKGRALVRLAHLLPPPLRDSAFAQGVETFSILRDLSPPLANADQWLAFAKARWAECSASAPPCPYR